MTTLTSRMRYFTLEEAEEFALDSADQHEIPKPVIEHMFGYSGRADMQKLGDFLASHQITTQPWWYAHMTHSYTRTKTIKPRPLTRPE